MLGSHPQIPVRPPLPVIGPLQGAPRGCSALGTEAPGPGARWVPVFARRGVLVAQAIHCGSVITSSA